MENGEDGKAGKRFFLHRRMLGPRRGRDRDDLYVRRGIVYGGLGNCLT